MAIIRALTALLRRNREGSVALWTALTMPLILGGAILGVDVGYMSLQKREMQGLVDLAALSASSHIGNVENQLAEFFALNGTRVGVATANGVKIATIDSANKAVIETLAYSDLATGKKIDGMATFTLGQYSANPDLTPDKRFLAGISPYSAVQVTLNKRADLVFAAGFFDAPNMSVQGTASSTRYASFSIGSRLASLDGGILNAILGGLLGTSLSLKVMDYEQLAKVDLELFSFLDALNIRLGLNAVSYSDILKTDISLGTLLDQMGKTNGIGSTASQILNTLSKTLGKTKLSIKLEEILALGPFSQRPIGSASNMTVHASLFELISAAAVAANGGKQVGVDLGVSLPGLANVSLNIAIGEPPVGTPSIAVGAPGSIIRTAQTRVELKVDVSGITGILGLKLHVPLYLEVANAEAQLASIQCGRGNGSVRVDAVPGLLEVALGTVDKSAFINFGKKPRVTTATLIDSLLLKVRADAHVTAGNLTKKPLTFTEAEIAAKKVKSVSTSDALTSLVQSLLKNLNLEVDVLFISLGTPKAVTAGLADTLALLTVPIDRLLYNLLLTLGIRVGEADVRVTGMSCRQPVLVQ